MNAYSMVDEFEKRVAEYSGAKYGVAVNSCTNAIMLSAAYLKILGLYGSLGIPKHTYVGVPYALINAGCDIYFNDMEWQGSYIIDFIRGIDDSGTYNLDIPMIVDSARRFTKGMYFKDSLYCLSFHETKLLSIGDGGMILTDDKEAYDALRQMRFDGRTPGKSVFDDEFTLPGYHCHMKPDVATRGLMLMAGVKDYNKDLPETYPDLSKHKIFAEGY